ncbi:MAG: hypothetical protein V3R16_09545 [Nitrospirales bacterium]
MADLLSPDDVREMTKELQGSQKLDRLCRDYLTLWDRYENMRDQRDNLEGRLGLLSDY